MIGFRLKPAAGRMPFDSKAVLTRVDDATRRVFGRFGALVRKAAIASVRNAPETRSAPAGSPPFSHVTARRTRSNRRRKAAGQARLSGGFKGLRHILYAYEPRQRSVVIGPASNRRRSPTIPEILEEGLLGVPAHPFMGPAFEQQQPKLPALWAGSVK